MHTSYNIISLNNSHSPQIVELILPIQQIEFNVAVTLEDQPDLLDIESTYHQSGGNFWGIFHQGELAGTLGLIRTGISAGAIRKMFVKKEFRGKEFGYAQQLLNNLIDYSKEHGIHDLYLGTVPQLKAAHRFYERNNFLLIDKTDIPSFFPFMKADVRFYHLRINE